MSYSAEQYQQQLTQLLPRGVLWQQVSEKNTNFTKWLMALAEEFARVDARAALLEDEVDPRTLYELLYDWELYLGLPDKCIGQLNTLEQRRNAVLEVLTSVGGQSVQYFINLAAKLGFVITVTEFSPFTVNSTIDNDLKDISWQFVWQVNSPATTIIAANVSSGVNEPIRTWGNKLLECVMKQRKPAHTIVLFAYV